MFVIDVALSIDGYWADASGESVYQINEMHSAGLVKPLTERTGAAVLSRRSFEMVDDPDWYADNYELQVPIFVVTDRPPDSHPKENGALTFQFVDAFPDAFAKARMAAGTKDVLVVGETSAVEAAFRLGFVDEIYLRIVARTLGGGAQAFGDKGISAAEFEIVETVITPSAVHIHLRRRKNGDR